MLDALLALGGDRGEPLALEIARKRGVISSEQREAVRVRAIEALGRHASSQGAADALREIASSRWGTADETRAAAQAAADAIARRLAGAASQSSAPERGPAPGGSFA